MADTTTVSDSYLSTAQQSSAAQDATPLSEPVPGDRSSLPPVASTTTEDNPADQSTVSEDPMAAAIAANQASNEEETSNEQKVVNGDSTETTAEEQRVLEAYQADNRAVLQAEETRKPQAGTPRSVSPAQKDWRVRMSLAPSATYLYNAAKDDPSHILHPLVATSGVVFPYTPTIQTGYRANYEPAEIAHTNYKSYFYKNSSVDDVTITAEFTAQDSVEASYLLAVIHFFKSITKMFYGKDNLPKAGTPPPLVYLSGFGAYQFDNHPMAISSFSYVLPNDVDYVRTTSSATYAAAGAAGADNMGNTSMRGLDYIKARLSGSNLQRGGGTKSNSTFNYLATNDVTYVPSKIQLSITGYPIVSRRDISTNFSLEKYASGALTRGSKNGGGGIW